MNILYLCDEYPPGRHGGIGTMVQLLARTMAQKGNKVIVAGFYNWGYGGEDKFDDEGVTVYRFRPGLSSPFFYNADSFRVRGSYRLLKLTGVLQRDIKRSLKKYELFLSKLITAHDIEIMEMPDYNDYMQFCKAYVPFPKLPVPTIVKLHGSITYINEEQGKSTPEHVRNMEEDVLKKADAVVSVSRYTAEKSAQYFNYSKKITVLYNGIQILKKPLKINKVENLVIFASSLVHLKGIYQLMKAWNIVMREIPGARLYVYGKGPTSKLRALLDKQNKHSVTFKGHVGRTELFNALASAEVAVFPSYAETFGLGVAEAMVCGTAVISSTRTSCPEIVEDGETGLLVDPDDIEGIAKSIIEVLNNTQLRERIATNGEKSIKEKFAIQKIADDHMKFYETIICK